MIIQIVIRLIINTDQYITRIGSMIEGSESTSSSNSSKVEDDSSTNSSFTDEEGQRIIKGIDNTVCLNVMIFHIKLHIIQRKHFENIEMYRIRYF